MGVGRFHFRLGNLFGCRATLRRVVALSFAIAPWAVAFTAGGQPVAAADQAQAGSDASAAERWHAGYTRWNDQWVKFDQLPADQKLQAKLAEYEKRRETASGASVADQLKLADWCRAQGLNEQERAHLSIVISLEPNHSSARTRLGFERVGSAWVSKADQEALRKQQIATKQAASKWMPKLKKAINSYESKNPKVRAEADRVFGDLNDEALVPVLLQAFEGAGDAAQQKTVDALDRLTSPTASLALARIAVLNPYGSVGGSAAEALRRRPMDHYVPPLLAAMSSPIDTRFRVEMTWGGQLVYRHLFLRETDDHKELVSVTQTVRDRVGRATAVAGNQLLNEARDREQRIVENNAEIAAWNEKVATVLNTATGQNLPASPDSWWQWWKDLNEIVPVSEKPVYAVSYNTETVIPTSAAPVSSGGGSGGQPPHECLVAGTPVWTLAGPRPVEQVRPGDLVLAQDIESGELAYKPVLISTTRPPGPVLRIETEKDTIRASGGHPFWVPGEGWVRARALTQGKSLHDIGGRAAIKTITEETDKVTTYNLVVADFHSYFVGDAKVLSHDNSIRRPTSVKEVGKTK